MRFLLAFVLSFVSLFAIAQAPPMILGGPQGINVTKSLVTGWLSVPNYVDTPVSNPGPLPWPGRGYVIQAIKNYRDATTEEFLKYIELGGFVKIDSVTWQDGSGVIYKFPKNLDSSKILDYVVAGDTSVWHYTGRQWKRVGGNAEFYFNNLIDGGFVSQDTPRTLRRFTISASEYYIRGVKYKYDTSTKVILAPKAVDSTGRIDVITLTPVGVKVSTGIPKRTPYKPRVGGDEIELTTIYFRPFDSIPNNIGSGENGIANIYRVPGKDSIFYTIDTLVFSIKDSIGISKNDTASMLNPYKFTAANGLTKDSTVFRLGGSLNQNTNINLNTRRLTFIGGTDTTRFFSNGMVSIGGTPDSTYMLNVNGSAIVRGILRTTVSSLNNASVIMNGNNIASNEASLVWGGSGLNLPSNVGIRNVVISPIGAYSSLTGQYNVLIGRGTGISNSSGNWNVLVGADAGNGITNGSGNTIIGGTNNAVSPNYSRTIQLISGGYENDRPDSSLAGLIQNFAFIGGGDDGQVGNQPSYINDYYFGGGHRIRLARFADVNFYAPSAQVRTDSVGANFAINAGRGTGTGLAGSIIFRTSSPTTSGTTLQTLSERARITPAGNLLVGTSSDSTFRLDVNGTARFRNNVTIDSALFLNGWKFGVNAISGSTALLITTPSSGRYLMFSRENSSAGFGNFQYAGFSNGDSRFVFSSTDFNTGNPDQSALVSLNSNTAGFLSPRMTNTQRDAISSPAQGLQLFSTTDSANYVYRGTGGGWQKIANEISGSATLDFPSTGHGNSADLTFTVTGASEGDVVALGIPNASIVANASFIAWVSATNTVTVRFNNYASSGNSDPASGTFKIKVFK